jgi:hypothetical protein
MVNMPLISASMPSAHGKFVIHSAKGSSLWNDPAVARPDAGAPPNTTNAAATIAKLKRFESLAVRVLRVAHSLILATHPQLRIGDRSKERPDLIEVIPGWT